jgi:hypothetical protein
MNKRTRKRKPEEELKTLYYYRQGVLKINFTDNSKLGLYAGSYVLIKKFDKDILKFLVEDKDGEKFWTDMVQPIRPEIEGHELYNTSFPLLMQTGFQDGCIVSYRTRNRFSSLKKEIRTCTSEFCLFRGGFLNFDGIPKGYNFALGYPDTLSTPFTKIEYEQ